MMENDYAWHDYYKNISRKLYSMGIENSILKKESIKYSGKNPVIFIHPFSAKDKELIRKLETISDFTGFKSMNKDDGTYDYTGWFQQKQTII